jgi:ABC-type dipeptide/oligopeptide/nickel transport system permease subunit
MLSHAVMRVVQVFPSYVMLSLVCVFVRGGLPSVEMGFVPSKDRCCGLSKVGTVETVGFRQVMWLVMLKSAKDQILGVDTLGQHVPPRVWYGAICLLIRYAIGCVSCSVEWGWLLSV